MWLKTRTIKNVERRKRPIKAIATTEANDASRGGESHAWKGTARL